jgi:hypothetical protein
MKPFGYAKFISEIFLFEIQNEKTNGAKCIKGTCSHFADDSVFVSS